MYMQTEELGGLKKLAKKAVKAVKKIAPVALTVAGAVGGSVLGAKAGQMAGKLITGSKKAGGGSGDAMRSAKEAGSVPYESMNAAQLQAEKSRLESKFASGQVKGKDVALGQQRISNLNALLAQVGSNAADGGGAADISKPARPVRQVKPRPRVSPGATQMPASVAEPVPFMPSNFSSSAPQAASVFPSTYDEETVLPEVTVEGKRDYSLVALAGIGALLLLRGGKK